MNISDVKVSVITPAHNDESFIKTSAMSVLNQTHKNIELIIVDDASSDKTREIISSIKDERIKFLKNDVNKGAAFSRNLAIASSTGEYIAFLDGDDYWDLEKLEKQLSFMIINNYNFSCTDYNCVSEDDEDLGYKVTGPLVVNHKQICKMDTVGCLTAIYKKSICPNISIPEDIYRRNDYALFLKVSENTDCYRLQETLSTYRKRKKSLSSTNKFKLFLSQAKMWKKIYGFCFFKAYFYALRNSFNFIFTKKKYIVKTQK